MSNLRDSLSERHVEFSRPSTSQVPQSQPFRSKSSCNKIKEAKVTSPSKKSGKHSSTHKQKQPPEESKIALQTNSNIHDISSQCQNLSLNSDPKETENLVTPVKTKKKNARKKLKKLQLQMPEAIASVPDAETLTAPAGYLLQQNMSSQHEFFMQQINPLNVEAGSRYMENLSHHPQYSLVQTRKIIQHTGSVPNTPLLLVPQRPNSASIPSSPLLQSEPTTPRYLQNAMQHPLLSQSFSMENHNYFNRTKHHNLALHNMTVLLAQKNVETKSPHRRNRIKNREQNNDDKKFESYMSAEDVEVGLKNNTLIVGTLRINPKQFQHAYVSSIDRNEQDVLLDGIKNRNRALEGDVVVVQLIDENEDSDEDNKQKKGKVVFIKEKVHPRTCIGILKLMPDKNRQKALFVPRDHRIPRLNIPFTCWPDNFYNESKNFENTLFLAKIIHWSDIRFASGKIICNIGQSGDMLSETLAILAQTGLDVTPFGPEVRHLYPRLDYTIPEDEIKLREDCRKLCLFSIDPSNCRDIDDAVSCRQLDNGNYEIGVHISDVAHFLTENTPLDEKVADKATTIYLVQKAYHMLPDELCMLCSLFPGVDKLAFSVFWEITEDAHVLSHRFSKTVIHSCAQLAYDHAQAILEDSDTATTNFPETYNGYQFKDIQYVIKMLGKIAAIFRKQRFENGALRIDQPKVSFHLNPNGFPDSFWIYESKESHQLIEEFMLLANMTVAKRINDDHPKLAFLRCHPPPSGYMLRQLAKSLVPMGINLDISSAGGLHQSLFPHVGPDSTDIGKAMVLNMLCAKPMARAKYFCADGCDDEDFHHYALNVPIYTHFTSPIRRYADIMVHRLLAASLKYRETPNWETDKVRMVAAQCNKQKYNAKKAGEMSTELYTLKYIEMHSPLVTQAVVVEVKEKYIDVIVVAMGLNRRIFFNNDFPGEYKCIKNDAGAKLSTMELTWNAVDNLPQVKQIIHVFSILQVELNRGDDMVKVETKLVRPQ